MAYNITNLSSTSTIKKFIFIVIFIVSLVIIKNLATSIYDLWSKQDLVVDTRDELENEKKENLKLKAQLTYVKSEEFIETEARDKLFMVKEGEKGVIVPSDLLIKKKEKDLEEIPAWKQWVNLFTN